MLGQTLTTETPRGAGSRAAAQVHDAVRRDILAPTRGGSAQTLTRDLVKPIVDLNLGPQRRYPGLQFALPDDQDAKLSPTSSPSWPIAACASAKARCWIGSGCRKPRRTTPFWHPRPDPTRRCLPTIY